MKKLAMLAVLILNFSDAGSGVDMMTIKVGRGPWMAPVKFSRVVRVQTMAGWHCVAVMVNDKAGNWSAPVAKCFWTK